MSDLCEICNHQVATTGVQNVKMCQTCFDTISAEANPKMYAKFSKLVEDKIIVVQQNADQDTSDLQETDKNREISENSNNSDNSNTNNKQNLTLKEQFVNFLLGLGLLLLGIIWIGGCLLGIVGEYTGETQHIPPFNTIYVLLLFGFVLAGIGLFIKGIILIIKSIKNYLIKQENE